MKITLIDQNTAVVGNKAYIAKYPDEINSCKGCSFNSGKCDVDENITFCGDIVRDDERDIIWVEKDSAPQSVEESKQHPHVGLKGK